MNVASAYSFPCNNSPVVIFLCVSPSSTPSAPEGSSGLIVAVDKTLRDDKNL